VCLKDGTRKIGKLEKILPERNGIGKLERWKDCIRDGIIAQYMFNVYELQDMTVNLTQT